MSSGAATWGWANMAAAIPATNYTARLQKISFYGDGIQTANNVDASSQLLKITDQTTDQASFYDRGSYGNERSQIHISPALMLRQQWVFQSNTTVLYNITSSSPDVLVYFTVELRITA